jgi:aminomethyltransferase
MEIQAIALKTTPLFTDHQALGAQMAPFAGWNMPIQYEGIIAETLHTRKSVSAFDICHMGEFLISGHYKKSGLDYLVSGRIGDLSIGTCKYTSLLNADGGVVDDLIVYRKGPEEWMIVVNAATVEKDKKHFLAHLTKDSKFLDLSAKLGKIDFQGPLAREIIRSLSPAACSLNYYTFIEAEILGEKNIVSRTGYTGELGYEIYAARDRIKDIWKTLFKDKRVKPAGLGARDVLRLEMGYSLYGQDIDEQITPLDAGFEKFIDFQKDFMGKSALTKQKVSGPRLQRIFFKTFSRRSPRHNHKIYVQGQKTGVVTSGTFSPHLEIGIGMGFTQKNIQWHPEELIAVGDENLKIETVITDRPFIKNTSLKI